jgi:hypothetical protein
VGNVVLCNACGNKASRQQQKDKWGAEPAEPMPTRKRRRTGQPTEPYTPSHAVTEAAATAGPASQPFTGCSPSPAFVREQAQASQTLSRGSATSSPASPAHQVLHASLVQAPALGCRTLCAAAGSAGLATPQSRPAEAAGASDWLNLCAADIDELLGSSFDDLLGIGGSLPTCGTPSPSLEALLQLPCTTQPLEEVQQSTPKVQGLPSTPCAWQLGTGRVGRPLGAGSQVSLPTQ